MDIGSAFSRPSKDPEWIKKIALAALFALLGVTMPAVYGWGFEIFRRQQQEDAEILPDITADFGKYFVEGLKYMLVSFAWVLPIMIPFLCAVIGGGSLTEDPDTEGAGVTIMITACCCLSLYILPVILLGLGQYVILAETGSIGHAINPIKAWKLIRRDLGGFIVAGLVSGLISLGLVLVTAIACCVGSYAGTAYATAVQSNLLAQVYQKIGGRAALADIGIL